MGTLEIALSVALLAALALVSAVLLRVKRNVEALRRPEPSSGLLVLQTQLDALRDQVRRSLEGGRLEIDRRLEETNQVVGQVRQGLGEVDRRVQAVTDAAHELRGFQELLRSPKVRGGVGEYLLADLLGQVLPGSGFTLQHAFRGGERVDAVIRVGGRLVPVDAKFPLENFRRLGEARGEDQRRTARRAFLTDVKRHVDDISRRYIRPGEGTFDFAMMYIPAEGVYREAILESEAGGQDLFAYSLSRRVVPVSPQSFYAYLQVIVLGLRGLSIEGQAREILEQLGTIRSRLDRFVESFDIASRHVGNAQRQLDEARKRLERLDESLGDVAREPDGPRAMPAAGLVSATGGRGRLTEEP